MTISIKLEAKKKERAERFGLNVEEKRRLHRAERFGIDTPETVGLIGLF